MRILILFLMLLPSLSNAQNLIRNGSFENPVGGSFPIDEGEVSKLEVWEDDFRVDENHSPDWFKNQDNRFRLYVNSGNLVIPPDGVSYVGMFMGELIE